MRDTTATLGHCTKFFLSSFFLASLNNEKLKNDPPNHHHHPQINYAHSTDERSEYDDVGANDCGAVVVGI